MQRTALIALATAVVAAGIATTATIMLTGDDDNVALISPSPSFSPTVTTTVETASPSPGASPSASPDGGSSASPAPTDAPPSASPSVTIRSAKNIDCGNDPEFCSSSDRMVVAADKLETITESSDPKSTGRPTIAMTSDAWKPNKQNASTGDEVGFIHVEVTVSNGSKDTFVFAKREIVLEIYKGGKLYDSFSTNGSGFDMTPGSKMTGEFDRPITEDGSYSWRAKVWYYKK